MKQSIEVQKIHTYSGHKDCLYTLERFNDSSFFSAGGDGMVVQWDLNELEKGTMIAKVPSSIYALKYDANTDQLIIGQNFEGIHIIDVAEKKESGSLKITSEQIFDIESDDKYIYVAMGRGEFVIISRSDLSIHKKLKLSDENARSIAINKDYVAVGYSDAKIRLFEKESFTHVKTLEGHSLSVFSLKFHPNNKWLISAGRDAHIRVWDLNTLNDIHSVAAHMYAINHIEFSRDNQHFVTCSMDKSIKVWDANSFQLKKVIDKSRHAGHGTSVNKMLWMPFNDQLLSCSDDRSISVWEINFGE